RWAILLVILAIVLFWLSGNLAPDGIIGTGRAALGWVTLIAFVVGVVWLALTVAAWFNEEYLVTTRRVMKVGGLLNKHSADSSLEKINDAVLDQHVFGRLLGFGDRDIVTSSDEVVDKYKMLA